MVKTQALWLLALLVLSLVLVGTVYAEKPEGEKGTRVAKTAINDMYATFLINNIFNYYSNNGDASYNNFTGNSALEFPKGSGKQAIFEDGLVWGAKVINTAAAPNDTAIVANQLLRVGGSAYRHGLQAGRILANGTADAFGVQRTRIFRVRPDINPSVPYSDAIKNVLDAEEVPYIARYESGITALSLYNAYIADWNEWPATEGAPFEDKNGNGTYESATDIPGVKGADQTLWHVSNDMDNSRTTYMYGSNPFGTIGTSIVGGIEMQRTIWGYKRTGALGNTIFVMYKVINKTAFKLDSMYFTQWADPDLGYAGDDFTGCDTTRGLGYVYNASARDDVYADDPVPATGFDFFQGPIVAAPGDSGVFNFKYRQNVRNLGMSSFNFFINGNAIYADPAQGNYNGTRQWYNLMQGLVGTSGAPYIDPSTGQTTKYCLAGDPLTGKGWIDGTVAGPDDRRMCQTTGPFTMMPGDTQEVVVAAIVGQGSDRLSSISVLKFYSDQAQAAFNALFDLPTPPAAPVITTANLPQVSGEILLDWSDPTTVAATEDIVSKGYAFEGYNVYQLATPAFTNPILLATFDVVNGVGKVYDDVYDAASGVVLNKPVQFGNDNGVQRYLQITEDKVRSKNLADGQAYYFAVTAYSYNAAGVPKSLESQPQVLSLIPQAPTPGVRYSAKHGDQITVTHSAGTSDGVVEVTVINPKSVTGHNYKVDIDTTGGTTKWNLKDVTAGTTKLAAQTNISGGIEYKIVDGLFVMVSGPAVPGMKDWTIPNGTRRWTWAGGADAFHLEGFYGAMGNGYDFWGSLTTYDQLRNILIKLSATNTAGDITNPADADVSMAYRWVRGCNNAPANPAFTGMYTQQPNYDFQDRKAIPLAVYNTETTPPTRLSVGFLENNQPLGLVDGKYWPPDYSLATGGNNTASNGPREWLFIFDVPYDAANNSPALATNFLNNLTPLMWVSTAARRGNVAYADVDEFQIIANHLVLADDQWTFSTVANQNSTALAQKDIEDVNVFPNPYFGFNAAEVSSYQKFVTFSHLPKKVTIRIFTLAGVLVRTLVKDSDSQFHRWDLNNQSGLPVSAGMFIAHIDMPTLGKTKVLKFAVIPEAQILEHL